MSISIQKIFKKIQNNSVLFIILIIGGMWLFRGMLLFFQAFPFNADEAIVGLMAKHILAGERPIFFYGQVYMGSLDAYLISFFYNLFGEQIVWIRVVQIGLFSITLIEFYCFMQIVYEIKFVSLISTLFLAFPAVNVVLYTTVSLGGYGEALVLGMAALLIAAIYLKSNLKPSRKHHYSWLLILEGVTVGLGLWANALSLLFSFPAVVLILAGNFKRKNDLGGVVKQLFLIGIGFLTGAVFWLYGLAVNGQILFSEMFGSAVSVENLAFAERIVNHLKSFLLFAPTVVFGLRPPWSVNWILLPLIPVVLLFWIVTFKNVNLHNLFWFQKSAFFAMIGSGVLVFIGFVFTSFGVDPSGRYFIPLVFLLSMLVGLAANSKRTDKLYFGLFIVVMIYQIAGSLINMDRHPRITTQFFEPAQIQQEYLPILVEFLTSKNEFFGYSNYWVSYPLVFLSDEEIICVPRLPYHPDLKYTSRDSRIKVYEQRILKSEREFYITTNNPALDDVLIKGFKELDIAYDYHEIGDYHIYYNLSEKIEPQQLVEYGLYR